jgi:molecular chaperone HtpG
MLDRIDEWMLGYLSEFDSKHLQTISKGTLDLGKLAGEEEKKEQEKLQEESKDLTSRFKEALGEKVQEVRVTTRLTDSPCCLVLGAYDMGAQMREIMKAAGQLVPNSKPALEINLQHPLIERLKDEAQDDRFASLANILFDQASLAEGGQLEDPAAYVKRVNSLLLEWLK